jgi:hypothetical protein
MEQSIRTAEVARTVDARVARVCDRLERLFVLRLDLQGEILEARVHVSNSRVE